MEMDIFGLEPWLGWFLIGTGLLIVEMLIAFTFYAAPIALGAFAATIVAALDGSFELQLVAFIIGALASLIGLRPIVRAHLMPPPTEKRSNVQSIIGRRAVALERVDIDAGTVRIGDDVWSARTDSEDVVVEAGTRAEVVSVQGVFAHIKPAPEPHDAGASVDDSKPATPAPDSEGESQ
jgi:membrane protein implicated in regulation of membrane protease activity